MIDEYALKRVEDLHRLKADGALSDEEFEKAKSELLNAPVDRQKPRAASPAQTDGDFFEWMLLPLKRYAQFEGRSSRKEYWLFHLGIIGFIFALALIGAIVGEGEGAGFGCSPSAIDRQMVVME